MPQHNFSSRYVVVLFILFASVLLVITARELRPSDHGLSYQEESQPPVQNDDASEMRSFFGETSSSSLPLPEAQNISDTWWSVNGQGEEKSRDGRRDHVRTGLLVGSAVCGLTGVVLLGVSGIIYLVRLHKQSPKKAERILQANSVPSITDK